MSAGEMPRIEPAKPASSANEVFARVQDGDRDALGELYDLYCDRAFRVALAVCGDRRNAEEAVEEAFVSIWNSRRSRRPRHATPAPWLMTLVRRRALDVHRHNTRDDCSPPSDVVVDIERKAGAPALRALVASLPEEQLEVITLAFYGELTHREIADELELPLDEVTGRMRLGLKQLGPQVGKSGKTVAHISLSS